MTRRTRIAVQTALADHLRDQLDDTRRLLADRTAELARAEAVVVDLLVRNHDLTGRAPATVTVPDDARELTEEAPA